MLRKATKFAEVKETCLEYAESRNVYSQPKKVIGGTPGVLDTGMHNEPLGIDAHASDKIDMLYKKFDGFVLLNTKRKPKPSTQNVICQKCKKPGHYTSRCQIRTESVNFCNYCESYGHSESTCYKKQPYEAKTRNQNQNTQKVLPLEKKFVRLWSKKRNQLCIFRKN